MSLRRSEISCRSRLLLPVDRGIARKEYHNSSVPGVKDVFARFGFPEEIVSNNGPQFASSEFRSFVESNWITRITPSPFLPNANGETERAVQTAKLIIRQRAPWLALLLYRETEISANGHSPTQLLIGQPSRRIFRLHYQPCVRVNRAWRIFAKTRIKPMCHTPDTTIVVTVHVRYRRYRQAMK